MTSRRRRVRVPASSANLGPGFDVLAASLSLWLDVEVSETGRFEVVAPELGAGVATDRSNLIVRAFEHLHPADGLRFEISSEIPLARGLGSSASAIVAGLMAADHLYELGLSKSDVFGHAAAIEGHPDNVAAATFGGFAVCGAAGEAPVRIAPPDGIEAIVAVPSEEVSTADARAAMPAALAVPDAVANVAAASRLVLGLERSDPGLISQGLADRLHQPARAPLMERSMALVEAAPSLGALGATISGAGPTVLIWSFWQDTGRVLSAVEDWSRGWAEVRRVPFSPLGADVVEI
ncbi:homoserine kinase [Thermoleophilia bacterium SCSIO 60948]|nr:homoserine kinase [Thermoleophilia bacterium SCSIO 60948]